MQANERKLVEVVATVTHLDKHVVETIGHFILIWFF
jgi:hypothetical protein